MAHKKNCGHTVPCGCEDQPLNTKPPCETGTSDCPTPDPCPETFCDECVVHCGDTIVNSGFNQGDRLDVILQKLTILQIDPACADPASLICRSVFGLKSLNITSTAITVGWLEEILAVNYQVEFKLATAVSWTLNPLLTPVVNPTDIISSLVPDTEYHIRVNSICGAGNCYSVIILVKTKP